MRLFDVDVDALDATGTLDRVFQLVDRPMPSQHVVLNAAKVVQMASDPRLREIVRSCDLVNADGASIVWASRALGRPVPERVAGIDLFTAIVERAASTGHSVYFLGATDEVLDEMLGRFRQQFPTLRIAGVRNGYWDDDATVVAAVRRARPDFLFLAIPSPRKEYWLNEHLQELGVPFVMGVGGSFDVVAGKVRARPAVGAAGRRRMALPPVPGTTPDVEAIPRRQHQVRGAHRPGVASPSMTATRAAAANSAETPAESPA